MITRAQWDAFVVETNAAGPPPKRDECSHLWLVQPEPRPPICARCHRTPTASPSQLETWRGCQRKHSYSRIRPREPNRWAAFGDRCHAIAEAFLKHGVKPDPRTPEGRTVIAGLHLLPTVGTAAIECRGIMWVDRDGNVVGEHTGWVQYVNGPPETLGWHSRECALALLFPGQACTCGGAIGYDFRLDMLYGFEPGLSIVVSDHKTTGDLDNAKIVAELETDPQRIVYSHWAAVRFEVELVVASWIYYRRAKGKVEPIAEPVTMTERAAVIAERFRALHVNETIPMVRSRVLPPDYLERDLAHCSAFGGCSYRRECHVGVSMIDLADASLYTKDRRTRAERELDAMTDLGNVLTHAGQAAAAQTQLVAPAGFAPPPGFAQPPAAAPARPRLTDALESYIASLPVDQQAAARDWYQSQPGSVADSSQVTIAPVVSDLPAYVPPASAHHDHVPPAPVAASAMAPNATGYVTAPVATPAQVATGYVTAPVATPAQVATAIATATGSKGKGKTDTAPAEPKPKTANSIALLKVCAEAGRTLEDTRGFLALLASIEGASAT